MWHTRTKENKPNTWEKGSKKPAVLRLPLISCLRWTGAGRSWSVQTATCASVCTESCRDMVPVLWPPKNCHGLWDTFCKWSVRHKSAPPKMRRGSSCDMLYLKPAAPRGCQSWRQSQVQLKKVHTQDYFQAASDLICCGSRLWQGSPL